jgi:hypothetical protein
MTMTTDLARSETPTSLAMMTSGGMVELAQLPEAEFEHRITQLKEGMARVKRIHQELMDPEVDYGVIPGTDKPTLKQPGSEKLLLFYRFAPRFEVESKFGDGLDTPPISVVVHCFVHLGSHDGPIVNEGVGAATFWEKRYRYRRGERACPSCSATGTVIKGKEEFGGGWLCFAKKGGCGAKFGIDDPAITQQVVGDIENPDPFDLFNTLVKMAAKRAQVDATKRATGTSALYTQDIEDMDQADREAGPTTPSPSRGQQRAQQSTRGAEREKSHAGATGADVRSCSEPNCGAQLTNGQLTASLQKFKKPLCPRHQKAQEQDLEMQPPGQAPPPNPPAAEKTDRKKLMDQLYAVYSKACETEGFESDDVTMRRHLGDILTSVHNERMFVKSRKDMTDEQIRECVGWLKQNGLPDHAKGDPFAGE